MARYIEDDMPSLLRDLNLYLRGIARGADALRYRVQNWQYRRAPTEADLMAALNAPAPVKPRQPGTMFATFSAWTEEMGLTDGDGISITTAGLYQHFVEFCRARDWTGPMDARTFGRYMIRLGHIRKLHSWHDADGKRHSGRCWYIDAAKCRDKTLVLVPRWHRRRR